MYILYYIYIYIYIYLYNQLKFALLEKKLVRPHQIRAVSFLIY